MNSKIEITLQELGLTKGEIKVYLSLIELKSTTVGPIIDKAQVSSSKVYIIIEKLINKGLVNYILKGKTKYFQASSPISLKDYLEIKEKKLKETKESLNKVISKIKSIQKEKKTPDEARIYRGYKAMRTAWIEAIETIPKKGNYHFISKGFGKDPRLKIFFSNIALKLKEKEIKILGLANIKEKKLYEKIYKKLGYEMKYTKQSWPSDISIIGDFLIILNWDKKEPTIYSIKSQALVKSYLIHFKETYKKNQHLK
jgi:sugar-specific transcriptional regulator TrmB